MDMSTDHADPYRTRHGRPLESPINSSTRDPRFATRSMGVVDTSPLRPAEGRRRGIQTSRRAHPYHLEWAQARGLDARLHLLGMHRTQANVDTCVWHRRGRLEHCRCRMKPTPRTLTKRYRKTLQEHPRSCKASGSTLTGALARLHGTAQQTGGKKVPSASISLCGFLTGTTAEARGLLSRGPLITGGNPLFRKIIKHK
jgi:hypothetical protein